MVDHFWERVEAIFEDIFVTETINWLIDADVLIERLSSFIVQKIMVVRHV